jgi:hypothetical protein
MGIPTTYEKVPAPLLNILYKYAKFFKDCNLPISVHISVFIACLASHKNLNNHYKKLTTNE